MPFIGFFNTNFVRGCSAFSTNLKFDNTNILVKCWKCLLWQKLKKSWILKTRLEYQFSIKKKFFFVAFFWSIKFVEKKKICRKFCICNFEFVKFKLVPGWSCQYNMLVLKTKPCKCKKAFTIGIRIDWWTWHLWMAHYKSFILSQRNEFYDLG